MIKLLNVRTGNIFTLPDEEALKIKANDRGNDFKLLDAGFTEEKEESISIEEAKKIAETPVEKLDDSVADDAIPESKPSLPHTHEKEYLEKEIDLEKASAIELKGYCGRLGIKVAGNASKKTMIEKIRETGIVK